MTKIVHLAGVEDITQDEKLNTLVLNDLDAEIAETKSAPDDNPRKLLQLIPVFGYISDRRDLEIDYDPNAPIPTRETEELIPSPDAIMADAATEEDVDEDEEDDGTDFGGTERDDDLDEDEEYDEDEDDGPATYNLYALCRLDPDNMLKVLLEEGETVESEKARIWWIPHGTTLQLEMESSYDTEHMSYQFRKDELPGLVAAFRSPPNGFSSNPTPVYFNSWGQGTGQMMIVMHTVSPSRQALPKDHPDYRDDDQIDDRMIGHLRVTIMDINGVNSTLLPHAVALAMASQIEKLHALLP